MLRGRKTSELDSEASGIMRQMMATQTRIQSAKAPRHRCRENFIKACELGRNQKRILQSNSQNSSQSSRQKQPQLLNHSADLEKI